MRKFWLILLMLPLGAIAQTQIDVTFRYVLEPGFTPVRVFVPGAFNNWGPNASGVIATGAVSQMELDASGAFYKKTIKLTVGQSYMYKVHFHKNTAGTDWQWVLDPLNPKVNTADNNNSVLDVVSPMAFQPAREVSATDEVKAFSAGLFSTSAITQMTFEINGVAQADAMNYYSATTGIFRYVPTTPLPPGTGFKVTFTDAAGKTATAELKQDPPPVVTKAARPSYAVEGINYNPLNPTEATLVLYAPKKQYVYAIGDFSNWEKQAKYLMMKDSTAVDQVYWWVTLTGLTPGTEYAYQYLVDGKIRIADPFANKVLDPSNDQYIPTTTYPSLKAYPAGKTSYHVSVLQTNKPKYTWTATNYQRPAQHKLVIYELHIRDFIAARNFKAIQDTLSYLKKLGVNAIEFMPVQEFDGNDSWGYNPAFYFALDKYYGTELAFKQFIDTCHQNGIAVIMDVVYNHQTGTSPFARLYNESPTGDPSANVTASNYWLNTTARHPFNVFIDANHESWQMQRLLDRANQYWLTEFKIDGFRYDLSKGFTQTYSTDATMSNYDASRIRNLKRMADVVWATDPTAYVILEHFATNAEEKELAEYGTTSGKPGMMLWGNSNYTYNEATMGWHDNGQSNFEWVYFGKRGWSAANVVGYMESHDEERLMYKNLQFGNVSGKYSIKDLWTAIERQKLAGAFFFTIPGPKMIWQFGELGYDYSIETNGRTGSKPIKWDYRSDPTRYRLYKTWAALINLRKNNPVFDDPKTQVDLSVNGSLKRMVLNHSSMRAVVIGNFGVTAAAITPSFPVTGTWYDYFSGASLSVTDLNAQIQLLPGEFRIYTTQQLATPEAGLIRVDQEDEDPTVPTTFALLSNYPNPFNPSTMIRYQLGQSTRVTLEVFDVTGRKMATLAQNQLQPQGTHEALFDASGLPSGLYLARLSAGAFSATQKLILAK